MKMKTDMKYTNKYDDIINLPHHVSETRPHMSASDRAAQFSPFAALTGHSAALKETARRTDDRAELDEEAKDELDEKLREIMEKPDSHPEVTFICFVPDERKEGGSYCQIKGKIKKTDSFRREIHLEDGRKLLIKNIIDIDL